MAIHWQIPFKSLRSGTVYTVNIYDASYTTGNPVVLKGGAQPFSTQEMSDEDMFTPVRTQTGHIRIVDDGKDANGTSLAQDWWKTLVPENDTSRPVTLTHVEGSTTIIDWQGFMQAQTFSGELYGNPQEREFPIQCCLSVLRTQQVSTSETSYRNFAFLLNYMFGCVPTHSFSQFVIQGGADAREWLRKKLDWRNFLNISEGDVSPQYNLYQILEDVCRFWGWTARTYRQQVIFTMADDSSEPNALTLTPAQLQSIGSGTTGSIGSVAAMYSSATIGNSFASTDNSDMKVRGYSKVVVTSDCNKSDSEIVFAPQSIRDLMENTSPGYTWHGDPDNAMVGYFSTPQIKSFSSQDSRIMSGGSSGNSGFSRRQVYTSEDSDSPEIIDCIEIRGPLSTPTPTLKAWLASTYEMSFPGGSFTMQSSIYEGWEADAFVNDGNRRQMAMAIGIGPERSSASTKWLNITGTTPASYELTVSWSTTKQIFQVRVKGVPTLSPAIILTSILGSYISKIPVDANLSGRVFIEFYGSPDVDWERIGKPGECNFELANFTMKFSRDAVSIASSRERSAIKHRLSRREYSATTNAQASDTYNVDCIFASDNEMDYGFGLLMNADGSFMEKAHYGSSDIQPEQYLVNRMAAFFGQARRVLSLSLNNETITPLNKTTVNNTSCYPISISRNWRDDEVLVTLIEC